MREHDPQPRIRGRFIATTDSDHELPIFPNLAKNVNTRRPEPALGERHNLRDDCGGLRLRRGHGCLVTQGRWLRHRPVDRRALDREIIAWHAVVGSGISGSMIRDMMLEAVESRFGALQSPAPLERPNSTMSPS